jgi:hypothetical protein
MNRLTKKLVYSSPSVEDIAFESEQCLTNASGEQRLRDLNTNDLIDDEGI